jgi:SAM-dependent methyltransferase
MKYIRFCLVVWFTVALLFVASHSFSQPGKGYQPEDGQEGKDVRWFPTPQELVDKMLGMAKITPSDFLIDLGSGDGRTVITAAKLGVRGVGIEFNPDLVELSKQNAVKEGVKDKTEFIKADLFSYDFSKATVLTLFLLPEINLSLRPKILDMKPGTRVVSTTFAMQKWSYDSIVKIDPLSNKWNTAYLWIVPAKIQGTWKMNGNELKLIQKFQMVSGTLTKGGKSSPLTEGRLRGKDLRFKVDGVKYKGIAEQNTINGTFVEDGKTVKWHAVKK